MKKLISLILAIVMCLGLCACGGGGAETASENSKSVAEEDPQEIKELIINHAKDKIYLEFRDKLGAKDISFPTVSLTDEGENEYKVSGKVQFYDEQYKRYSASFKGTAKYSSSGVAFSYSVEDLYKN